MRIPMYWARAVVDETGRETSDAGYEGFYGVGWSDLSQDDAHRTALQRARVIADRYARGDDMFSLREQYYADRPLREPIINELDGGGGERLAIITQNLYGAYVMNTAEAVFVDIDVPPAKPQPGAFAKLFGAKPKQDPRAGMSPEQRIQETIRSHHGLGMKVYRTPAGFRGLLTSAPMAPGSPEAEQLLHAFDSDPLYITLCRSQQSFRARLTPKPWRIGMDNPPRTYPFFDPAKQAAFNQWKQAYDQRIAGYGACEPLSDAPWGNPQVHPAIAPVLAMHDQLACKPGMPIA